MKTVLVVLVVGFFSACSYLGAPLELAPAGQPLPPKNSNAPPVTDEDIAILKQWIDKGAP